MRGSNLGQLVLDVSLMLCLTCQKLLNTFRSKQFVFSVFIRCYTINFD